MTAETFDRVNRVLLRMSLVFALVVAALVTAPPSHATAFDGAKAAAYASQYACNRNPDCRHTLYPHYSNDCTNFVSAALFDGDMPFRATGGDTDTVWWAAPPESSLTWRTVDHFRAFMVGYSHRGKYVSVSQTAQYTPASKGDVYVYDFGKGEGYSHLSMSTNWGTFINYYDPVDKKNYNSVTQGKGDKIAQHTTDRDGAPWNWGYYIEKDSRIRAKRKTVIIHWTL